MAYLERFVASTVDVAVRPFVVAPVSWYVGWRGFGIDMSTRVCSKLRKHGISMSGRCRWDWVPYELFSTSWSMFPA